MGESGRRNSVRRYCRPLRISRGKGQTVTMVEGKKQGELGREPPRTGTGPVGAGDLTRLCSRVPA